tara:strand:- start:425 stop:1840 length:1416 start_codon:yes stop_codon:yes gene_type:complete
MIPVLTKEQAYKLDKDTIESGHLSQADLMDNAGKTVAQFFCEKIKDPFNQKVLVVCGKGNNGGDGVITHSYLKKYNVSSKIVFTEEKHGHTNLIKKYKISQNDYSIYSDKIISDKYDWIIDGIFGIGLSRKLNSKYKKIINNLNVNKNIISIDIQSGMFADTDNSKNYINSKHVITFGYTKLGHYLYPINSLLNYNIGFKKYKKADIELIGKEDISKILKDVEMKCNIHKYSKGTLGISSGSNKYPGAAILCSKAAYKTGARYVSLCFSGDKEMENSIKTQYPDILLNDHIFDTDFALFGPGYNYDTNFPDYIDEYKSIVCDATLLKSCSIGDFPQNSILTPHVGEFFNLFNNLLTEILDLACFNKIQNLIKDRIIILKSFNTFIITKDMIYIMNKGPSLLATAGTGDVLSGILVSLLSQGYSRLEASILGTYLHAEAANYYMNNISKDGMTASDLIDCIPHAFNKLRVND